MPKQANQPFFYSTPDGVEHFVAKGQIFTDKDPVLKGRDILFDHITAEGKSTRTRVVVDVPDLVAQPDS